jgi:hypothetical protein
MSTRGGPNNFWLSIFSHRLWNFAHADRVLTGLAAGDEVKVVEAQ